MIELNCKVVKKVATPLPPPFPAKNFTPHQVTRFLEGPSPPLIRGMGGGGGGFQLCHDYNCIKNEFFH